MQRRARSTRSGQPVWRLQGGSRPAPRCATSGCSASGAEPGHGGAVPPRSGSNRRSVPGERSGGGSRPTSAPRAGTDTFAGRIHSRSPVSPSTGSSRDRAGPSSCYTWGLIPLSYTIEALCRAGCARDARLRPALNALLGAQRESGGWCRNLGGHTGCSIHAIRALGAHPRLRESAHADRALSFWRTTQLGERGPDLQRWWRGTNLFAALQAAAAFESPLADEILRDVLAAVAPRQRKNGTFGTPCRVDRVAAVLVAQAHLGM